MELVLERRSVPDKTVVIGPAMLAPLVDEDYWDYRVKVSDTQAVIGFQKFGTVGVGFALEEDWNRNLPAAIDAAEIAAWIEPNKGDDTIPMDLVVEAVKLIQQAVREDMGDEWMDERVKRHAESRAKRSKS